MESSDEFEAILQEIRRLPSEQQEALRLHYSESFTYPDSAKRRGVSVATRIARLTKARETLRERLESSRES